MKRLTFIFIAFVLTTFGMAQTLNVQVGNVSYLFPAAQSGEMTYTDGTTLTIMGRAFSIAEIDSITLEKTNVTDNLVSVVYSGTTATVRVAGNVAQYVWPSIGGAHVYISQTNTTDVDGDEITYQISGTTTDGSLTLAGSHKCTVSLAGVTLTNPESAAINITNSKRIQLSAKAGTVNTLTDGNGAQKACIYSKGQLQLQGTGTLNVVGQLKHAIKSASYITVKNLTLNITSAVGDGISCEEYFQMKSGSLTISGTSDDGIQCDLDDASAATGETAEHADENTGNVYIDGGTLNVTTTTAGSKCVKCDGSIAVTGGTLTLNVKGSIDTTDATDLSYATGLKAGGNFTQSGGDITVTATGASGCGISVDGTFCTTQTSNGTLTITNSGALTSSGTAYFATSKGIRAGSVAIEGGTIEVTMTNAAQAAKGIKANSSDGTGNITVSGGNVTVTVGGAGAYDGTERDAKGASCLKADNNISITDGTLTLRATGTGGKCIRSDGTLAIGGGNITATTTGSKYKYSSSVTASPKAIKSTGAMTISGGTVNASSSGHEAIETKGTLTITDGTVVALSSSDDAINSASHMYLKGGNVSGTSNGNDGIDSNGNMTISGGTVIACGAKSPECGLDAAERYYLYITGGTVLGMGGGNNSVTSTTGSQCVLSTTGSGAAGTAVSIKSGSTTLASFSIPAGYSPSGGGVGQPGGGGRPGGGGSSGGTSSFSYLLSCPGLTSGTSYSVSIGSTSTTCKAATSYSGR